MGKRIVYIEGLDGQVELLQDRVIIHRKGFVNSLFFGFNSRREIPIGAISEVAFRDATPMRFGIIEFVRSGRSHTDKKGSKDHNACIVKFNRKTAKQFEAMKEKVFELIEQYQRTRH